MLTGSIPTEIASLGSLGKVYPELVGRSCLHRSLLKDVALLGLGTNQFTGPTPPSFLSADLGTSAFGLARLVL